MLISNIKRDNLLAPSEAKSQRGNESLESPELVTCQQSTFDPIDLIWTMRLEVILSIHR